MPREPKLRLRLRSGIRTTPEFSIRGMGKVNSKFVIILNVGNVLSIDDLALLEQANAQGVASANEDAAE